eukprot:gnl/MRDRNA2_/MRDRNA2_239632_c0_seq1.p1 gnl/MRDRNA2_/MRDRNA2_239632_c0~~gnl/MRDRNA2_/MRDRNA2_239632_c0_seq1.p1  ORF type:complete len:171 (+),score=31.56 gnl/MRDRNA2_/MRDRNA2_239632_c0_seq1:48-515(+)
MSDNSVYGMMMEWAAEYLKPPQITVRNIREVIREKSPKVFKQCCKCSKKEQQHKVAPPCSSVSDLLGDPCLAAISTQERIEMLVHGLGIFGLGNYNRFMYVSLKSLHQELPSGDGVHWCYNNCFKTEALDRMMEIMGSDEEGLKMFAAPFARTFV